MIRYYKIMAGVHARRFATRLGVWFLQASHYLMDWGGGCCTGCGSMHGLQVVTNSGTRCKRCVE